MSKTLAHLDPELLYKISVNSNNELMFNDITICNCSNSNTVINLNTLPEFSANANIDDSIPIRIGEEENLEEYAKLLINNELQLLVTRNGHLYVVVEQKLLKCYEASIKGLFSIDVIPHVSQSNILPLKYGETSEIADYCNNKTSSNIELIINTTSNNILSLEDNNFIKLSNNEVNAEYEVGDIQVSLGNLSDEWMQCTGRELDGYEYPELFSKLTGIQIVSPDWINRIADTNMAAHYYITYVQETKEFLAVGQGSFLSSKNGIDWTSHTVPDSSLQYIGALYWNGRYYLIQHRGVLIYSSDDLISWTTSTGNTTSIVSVYSAVSIINNYLYIAKNSSYICYAELVENSDITSLNYNKINSGTITLLNPICFNGKYVTLSTVGTTYTSETATFPSAKSKVVFRNTDGMNSWACSDDIVIAVGNRGLAKYSTDLVDSTDIDLACSSDFNRVRYIDGIFYIVGSNGAIFKSSNGIDWIKEETNCNYNIRDIASNGEVLIAICDDGYILTKTISNTLFNIPNINENTYIKVK